MTGTTPKRPQLNIADPDNGVRDMLDDLRALERPVPSQSDVLRRVVREAWEAAGCGGKVVRVDVPASSPFLADLKAAKPAAKGNGRK